jgi:glycerophosphoryl diester phosphodiesterase
MNGDLSAHHAEGVFHHLVNMLYRRWPRSAPRPHRLHACRIVSHRGEHDNHACFENTLAAFDKAVDAGVWGIELDVRWTRDLIPVVFHDADTQRLFNEKVQIRHMTVNLLKEKFPLIPTFSEVVDRYGGRQHLMIEIKTEPYPRPAVQSRRMQRLLRLLNPGKDFHLMGLDPAMFTCFGFLPAATFIPIARVRIDRFSRLAAAHGWGGLAGHYLLATRGLIIRHHGLGQRIGTGFVDSRRCLYREVSRGVDWIFSNRAAAMQAVCR